jgi:hypothetical protein
MRIYADPDHDQNLPSINFIFLLFRKKVPVLGSKIFLVFTVCYNTIYFTIRNIPPNILKFWKQAFLSPRAWGFCLLLQILKFTVHKLRWKLTESQRSCHKNLRNHQQEVEEGKEF